MSDFNEKLRDLFQRLPAERNAEAAQRTAETERLQAQQAAERERQEAVRRLGPLMIAEIFDTDAVIAQIATGLDSVTGKDWNWTRIHQTENFTHTYRAVVDSDEGGYIYDSFTEDRTYEVKGAELWQRQDNYSLFAGWLRQVGGSDAYAVIFEGWFPMGEMIKAFINEDRTYKGFAKVRGASFVHSSEHLYYYHFSGDVNELRRYFTEQREKLDSSLLHTAKVLGKRA